MGSRIYMHIGHSNSPSADCKSKIGDMRGDFRAIPIGIASLRERTAGRGALRPDQ